MRILLIFIVKIWEIFHKFKKKFKNNAKKLKF